MFLETIKDIGTIKVGSVNKITFDYTEVSKITEIKSPCDCSIAMNDSGHSRVVIEYKAKPIPEHLKLLGKSSYAIRKIVTIKSISSIDGTESINELVFTGIVIG